MCLNYVLEVVKVSAFFRIVESLWKLVYVRLGFCCFCGSRDFVSVELCTNSIESG